MGYHLVLKNKRTKTDCFANITKKCSDRADFEDFRISLQIPGHLRFISGNFELKCGSTDPN